MNLMRAYYQSNKIYNFIKIFYLNINFGKFLLILIYGSSNNFLESLFFSLFSSQKNLMIHETKILSFAILVVIPD